MTATGGLQELLPSLADLRESAIVRPHTDPHAAAVTALLVADWLTQPELAPRLAQAGLDVSAPRSLARTARAILAIVDELGGDYLSDVRPIPAEIEARGQIVLSSTIKELVKALPYDREVRAWIEAVSLGSGAVDLVYDLRALAELLTLHADAMRESVAKLPAILRAASDAIEWALRADEPPELALARGRLARLWTIFVPEYDRLSRAARVLARERGAEEVFPPLALVASHRRARRRPLSAPPRAVEAAKATTGSRRAYRAVLEQEVGIESESNFYLGFTENLSSAGFFVATYLTKPIGSKVEIVLTMRGIGGDSMRIRGVVRWHRAATDEGWPGMGVHFEDLAPEHEARIREFLALREPLFYDD